MRAGIERRGQWSLVGMVVIGVVALPLAVVAAAPTGSHGTPPTGSLVATAVTDARDCWRRIPQQRPLRPLFEVRGLQVLDLTGGEVSAVRDACLYNAGDEDAILSVGYADVVSSESGTCGASELAAGDDTCDRGGDGELAAIARVGVHSRGCGLVGIAPASDLPLTGPGAFEAHDGFTGVTAAVELGAMPPGTWCALSFVADVDPGAPDVARLLAQTDQLTFTIRFTMEGA